MERRILIHIGARSWTVAVGCVSACDTTAGSTVRDDGEVPQPPITEAP